LLPRGELSNESLWELTENFNREFGTARDAKGNWHLFSGTSKFIIRDLDGTWLYGPHTHPSGTSLASPADIANALQRVYGAKEVKQMAFGIVTKVGGVRNPIGSVIEGTYGIQKATQLDPGQFEVELFKEGVGQSQHVWYHADVTVTRSGDNVYLSKPAEKLNWIRDLGR
jgi:hypothetical protein